MKRSEIKKNIKRKYRKILCHISPILVSKKLFKERLNKKLDLKNPKMFNEKLMFLKHFYYSDNKVIHKCVDKYYIREYLKDKKISKNNLPELLNYYTDVESIDFNKLPDKFALKCTQGSGHNIICTDKSKLDVNKTKKLLKKWLKDKFSYSLAEMQYDKVKQGIILEKFIECEDNKFPYDYKLYCFYGEPKVVLVCFDRELGHKKVDFYDINWNKLNLRDGQNETIMDKPKSLNEMIKIAKIVSKDFPFVRVDFYEEKGICKLGELTFTPAACLGKYTEYGDKYLSDLLNIDDLVKEKNKI